MNMNIVAVNTNIMQIYDCLRDGETEIGLLNRANMNKVESITNWDNNRKKYPCEEFENYYKEACDTIYEVMTYDQFHVKQKAFLIDGKLTEITADQFNDALDVLPPLKWCTINNIEMFCMSEMYTGTYTNQYAHDKRTNKYYSAMVDVIDQSTWINALLKS